MSRVITEKVEITDKMLKPSKRLMDADALMISLKIPSTDCGECESVDPNYGNCMRDFAEACAAIKEAPIIEERKKGKWVKLHGFVTPGGDPVWCCSECGKGVHVFGIEHSTYNCDVAEGQWVACPNCGALMIGEE